MSKNVLNHISNIYSIQDLDYILNEINGVEFLKDNKTDIVANIPCSLDIETSSFYETYYENNKEIKDKRAIMYEWTLCLDGFCIIGRKWSDLLYCFEKIRDYFYLDEHKKIIFYIHNEGYEFQFIRKRLNWLKVFALDERKPVKCLCDYGIEFRCSYLLSGYSLSTLGKQLIKYKIQKLDGNLDYKKIRHSETPLTKEELKYCVNDCLVVVAYIQELIEKYGGINKLPLTKTGFVRNECRNECLYEQKQHRKSKKFHKYRNLMKNLILNEKVYDLLKNAFAGGFTHASLFHSGDVVKNVSSFDFASSYPYVICSEQFPMSSPIKGTPKSKEELVNYLTNYCCVFDIELYNVEPQIYYENYISQSKCFICEDCVENNGRVVSAKRIKLTITEQDYMIIRKFYKWDRCIFSNFYRFYKDYLPRDFVNCVLKYYEKKTTLKGVDGKEEEYMNGKEFVNSLYGMMVTDICREEILYNANDEWCSVEPNKEEMIKKYNNSIKRFLYYPWGVWVTAYARRNLFTGIYEFGEDYVYSDTDSIKVINVEKHREYINDYNRKVELKLKKAMEFQKLDFEMTRPKTIKGITKQLGVWEEETKEHIYTRFKTLGAKRYLVEQNGELHLTVSGLGKGAIKYMEEKFKDKVFENFCDSLYIPKGKAGKQLHTYIDEETRGVVVDYLGNECEYEELSSTHLEDADYSLSISEKYAKILSEFISNYEKYIQ